jgi:hypothetical protein
MRDQPGTVDAVVPTAQPEDVPAIRRFHLDGAAEGTSYGYTAANHEHTLVSLRRHPVVADRRSGAIGFGRGTVQADPGLPVAPQGKLYLQLDDLYASADYQRTDAGCKLLDFP